MRVQRACLPGGSGSAHLAALRRTGSQASGWHISFSAVYHLLFGVWLAPPLHCRCHCPEGLPQAAAGQAPSLFGYRDIAAATAVVVGT